MKRFKDFINENNKDDFKEWYEIIENFDVYQLMELLNFKYGQDKFKEVNKDLDEYEEDYNPDEFYELIQYRLEELDLFNDFLNNWKSYEIEKDENDSFHWRYRQKQQDKLLNNPNWD